MLTACTVPIAKQVGSSTDGIKYKFKPFMHSHKPFLYDRSGMVILRGLDGALNALGEVDAGRRLTGEQGD